SGIDVGDAIVVDGFGNAYVTGATYSADFPTTPGAFQTSFLGGSQSNAFVTKLNTLGTALLYSPYLGGSGTYAGLGGSSGDSGKAIAIDGSGNAYVTGYTISADFPTTSGAFQTSFSGGTLNAFVTNAFVTELNANGTGLIYSPYLGDSGGG